MNVRPYAMMGILFGSWSVAVEADQPAIPDDADRRQQRGHLRARPGLDERPELHAIGFRELGSFFNVREANPDVHACEWLFEFGAGWQTRSDGSDDDAFANWSAAYGLTDDLMAKFDLLPVNLGDGDRQGNGDLALGLFYRWVRESSNAPAIANWVDMRIPSGDGSSGVDASLGLGLTKSLSDRLRLHANGMIETLNGARGDEGGLDRRANSRRGRAREMLRERIGFELPPMIERANQVRELLGEGEPGRRSFRWELGVGVDYLFSETTLGALSYVHRSNEEEGLRNQHVLEVGVAQVIAEHQVIKLAVDVGLTGAEDTPNLAAKVQYAIAF